MSATTARPRIANLAESDLDDLLASGLTAATIVAAGIYTGSSAEVQAVLGYGIGTGMVIPYSRLNGDPPYARVKLHRPDGRGKRYRSPMKTQNRLYVPHSLDRARLADIRVPVIFCEGEKKAMRGCQDGLVCVALSGVWSWRTRFPDRERGVPLPDLDNLPVAGRPVYIVFDSDRITNPDVQTAERAFAAYLASRGARVCRIPIPPGPHGEKAGLDDYLIAHGIEAFHAIVPEPILTENGDWPAPEPVPDDLPPVPVFDVDRLLPDALAPWARDVAERTQCPVDYVGIGAVVAAAAVVGRQLAIRPKQHDDWTVVPNLWGAGVGRPGLMKTAAMNEGLRGAYRLAAEAHDAHKSATKEHDFRVVAAKAQRQIIEKKIKDVLARGEPIDELRQAFDDAAEPEAPTERRYLVNDATVEKLGVLLNENQNGLLLFRDELAGLLRTMERDGHENDRSFYNEAWNGTNSYVYDRVGRGTLRIEAACVSILGGIQPRPLVAYLREADEAEQDDGFIQRFQLIVWPDLVGDWQHVDRWPDTEARRRVVDVFLALDQLDLRALNATCLEGALPFLRFTPDAQAHFDAWLTTLERRIRRDGEESPVLIAHLAKYRSLMPSLALLFHLMDSVDAQGHGPVSARAAERAIAWCAFLEPHARRVYDAVVNAGRAAVASLAKKLMAGDLDGPFTVRDVRRKEWTGLKETGDILLAVDRLEALHWLRAEVVPPTERGGRKTIRYHVNPKARRAPTAGDTVVAEPDDDDELAPAWGDL